MLCKKCGAEYAEETNFCVKCGERIEPTDNAPVKISKLPKKAKYAIVAAIAVVSIAAIRYFNSVEYLEKRLTDSIWYSEPIEDIQEREDGPYYNYNIKEYHYDAKILRFRSNEECEMWDGGDIAETKLNIFWSLDFYLDTQSWELLDDKSLKLDGEYYEYGEDWYFKGGSLIIYIEKDYGQAEKWTFHKGNHWAYSYND